MKEVCGYLLAKLGGKDKPTAADVTSILQSVGIDADAAQLEALFADIEKLSGSVDDAIQSGMDKLAAIPSGGGGGAAPAGGDAPAAAAAAPEEEEESEEEESAAAAPGLFGDDSSSEESSSE